MKFDFKTRVLEFNMYCLPAIIIWGILAIMIFIDIDKKCSCTDTRFIDAIAVSIIFLFIVCTGVLAGMKGIIIHKKRKIVNKLLKKL